MEVLIVWIHNKRLRLFLLFRIVLACIKVHMAVHPYGNIALCSSKTVWILVSSLNLLQMFRQLSRTDQATVNHTLCIKRSFAENVKTVWNVHTVKLQGKLRWNTKSSKYCQFHKYCIIPPALNLIEYRSELQTLEHIKYSLSLENMQKTPAIAYCVCNCKQNCTQCVCLYDVAFEYVFYVLVLIPHKLMGSKPNGRRIENVVCYESWHARRYMHLDLYFVVKLNVKHIVLFLLWNILVCNFICGLLLFPPIHHFHFKKFWNSKQ